MLEEHSVPGLCTDLTVFESHENARAQLYISCQMYLQRKRMVVDENMKKYNEDGANYANSKQHTFKVGIM